MTGRAASGRPKQAAIPWATKGPLKGPGDRPAYAPGEGSI
jgi:hypothetical protein